MVAALPSVFKSSSSSSAVIVPPPSMSMMLKSSPRAVSSRMAADIWHSFRTAFVNSFKSSSPATVVVQDGFRTLSLQCFVLIETLQANRRESSAVGDASVGDGDEDRRSVVVLFGFEKAEHEGRGQDRSRPHRTCRIARPSPSASPTRRRRHGRSSSPSGPACPCPLASSPANRPITPLRTPAEHSVQARGSAVAEEASAVHRLTPSHAANSAAEIVPPLTHKQCQM